MRRTRLIPALLVLLFSACNERLIDEQNMKGEMGEVQISLEAEERVEIVSARSGSDLTLPEKDEFWIEIFNSDDTRIFRKQYSEVAGRKFGFNEGNYTLLAYHGDSLGVGFNKPYFMAKVPFEVEGAQLRPIEATAILSNVKVAVNYGDEIKSGYSGFYTEVRHAEYKKKVLTFSENEQRSGYIPGGGLTVTVYAVVDGELKCFTLKGTDGNPLVVDCEPNDFITFHVNTAANKGGMVVNVLIDNGVELVTKEFEVPAEAVDETMPSIVLSSFDENDEYYIVEGVQDAPDDLGFTYKAYSGIKECTLTIDSDYLASLGVPSVVDLKNLTSSMAQTLENAGFFIAEHANVGVVGIEDIIYSASKTVQYSGGGVPTPFATMTLVLKDTQGHTVAKTVNVAVKPNASAAISLPDHDVWATKVVNPTVTVSKGNVSLMDVQYSMDGKSWTDFMKVTSTNFQMGTINDLTPDTKYYLRVLYDDWYQISDVFSFTTEDDAQVGNAGFENWNTLSWAFNHNGSTGGQSSPMNYYKPWASSEYDIWWDSNTTNSLRSSLTMGYTFFKTFPLVHYSTDAHSGTKSAQLTVANVGNSNSTWATTGSWYVGELFIGKGNDGSDGGWSKTTDGHSFASRPQSLTFWYEYAPYSSSDFFTVEVAVKAQDGTVLATASANGTSVSQWKEMTLPLTYNVTDRKAASIHIAFKASGSSSHDCSNGGGYLEIAGSKNEGNKYRIKLSATLRIDDVQLNY